MINRKPIDPVTQKQATDLATRVLTMFGDGLGIALGYLVLAPTFGWPRLDVWVFFGSVLGFQCIANEVKYWFKRS